MSRLIVTTVLCLLALAPAADAAIVDVQDTSRKIRFIADPGEVNRVTVTQAGSTISFEDLGAPVNVALGETACTSDAPNKVTCTMAAADYRPQVEAEDGDDEIVSQAQILTKLDGDEGADRITGGAPGDEISGGAGPDTLDGGGGTDLVVGGDGDDVIRARDALRDTIVCGLGNDTGDADVEDDVNADCEGVAKPLAPPTVYEGGTGTGDGGATTENPGLHLGELPKPAPGQRVAVGITSGTARVKLPGSSAFVEIDPTKPVPVGSTLDARAGVITLVSASNLAGATQSAQFTGGVFTVGQKRGTRMTTILTLTGGDFSRCPRPSKATARAAAAPKKVRRLWGSGHGRFTTRGRNSAATVRGTIWTVTDRCDGTLTTVQRGLVAVKDLGTKRTHLVRAGQKHLAKRR